MLFGGCAGMPLNWAYNRVWYIERDNETPHFVTLMRKLPVRA